MNRLDTGSVEAFDASWRNRDETKRYHFKRGEPDNQVQFAFQNHWRVFQSIMGTIKGGRALEVGCGRGSMAAFFADAGFEAHLLDTSQAALASALDNFAIDRLDGSAVCGDALNLPYADGTFDVIVSIGLLEHFKEIAPPLREQMRVLKPGGVLLGYVVPERTLSVQTLAAPLNAILRVLDRLTARKEKDSAIKKQLLYRNDFSGRDYISIVSKSGAAEFGSFGMFPVPLVSHSWYFPFTAMSPRAERRLMKVWRFILGLRSGTRDPWVCSEKWGLAFLVWARRGRE